MTHKLTDQEIQDRQDQVNDNWSVIFWHQAELFKLEELIKPHKDAIKMLQGQIVDLTKEILSGEVEADNQPKLPGV
jgi:hypothetical protein